MTFKDLEQYIQSFGSIAECETFLKENVQEIRDLFYSDLAGGPAYTRFDAEDAAISLLHSDYRGELLRGDIIQSHAIGALLIYFIASAERMGFHHLIQRIAHFLPAGDLKVRAEVLFKYKYITNAEADYRTKFTEIVQLLDHLYATGNKDIKAQCADIAIEYFCVASTNLDQSIVTANYKALKSQFLDQSNCEQYPFLYEPTINAIIHLPIKYLAQESEEANIRIAKAFYDEAATLLPVLLRSKSHVFCGLTGDEHDCHCPPGLHKAKKEIFDKYQKAHNQTNTYIKMSLGSRVYTDFVDEINCMRYLRQYQPFHMPQIETAVEKAMVQQTYERRSIHILDIGAGTASLYCILASFLHRGIFKDFTFEITVVEPSKIFHDYIDIITKMVRHPQLQIRDSFCCRFDQLPLDGRVEEINWYFIANAITPLVAYAGSVALAVDTLCDIISATATHTNQKAVIIAENTKTVDFKEFCNILKVRGQTCLEITETSCDGTWLNNCRYYLPKETMRPTRPYLKYAYFTIP